MEEFRDGKFTMSYEVGEDCKMSTIEIREDATWHVLMREFTQFLSGMGYVLPEDVHDLGCN